MLDVYLLPVMYGWSVAVSDILSELNVDRCIGRFGVTFTTARSFIKTNIIYTIWLSFGVRWDLISYRLWCLKEQLDLNYHKVCYILKFFVVLNIFEILQKTKNSYQMVIIFFTPLLTNSIVEKQLTIGSF